MPFSQVFKVQWINRIPVEVYWSVALAPLYQLVKFPKHGKGMTGTEKIRTRRENHDAHPGPGPESLETLRKNP